MCSSVDSGKARSPATRICVPAACVRCTKRPHVAATATIPTATRYPSRNHPHPKPTTSPAMSRPTTTLGRGVSRPALRLCGRRQCRPTSHEADRQRSPRLRHLGGVALRLQPGLRPRRRRHHPSRQQRHPNQQQRHPGQRPLPQRRQPRGGRRPIAARLHPAQDPPVARPSLRGEMKTVTSVHDCSRV